MARESRELPTDPEELRRFALALQAELYAQDLYVEKLKGQLARMKRARFGRSSETIDREIEQLELIIGEAEAGAAEAEARAETEGRPARPPRGERSPNRAPLPEHLPREILDHEGACVCPSCGSKRMRRIAEEKREVLEWVPSHFKVVVHVRPVMGCRDCEAVAQPEMPSLPIEKGRPGPSLLAHVLVAKYCDHLPLHRQAEIYAREGVELCRSTLADWVGRMAWLVRPVYEAIGAYARAGPVTHADDTPVPVLEPGRGSTRQGRLWAVVRDERPWGSENPIAAFYAYSPDRKGMHAEALLRPCRGYLQADAYAGFARLYEPHGGENAPALIEAACWSHARRGIYDEYVKTKSPIAKALLDQIGALFLIERELSGSAAEVRLAARRERSAPELERLKTSLEAALQRISRKSDLAVAIRYALTRWPALTRFLNDGRIEMTNNAAERAIRPLTLGRRNWTFLGSDAGGERAAVFFTLLQTCRLNGVNPEAYLADLIDRIADHPSQRIEELLPWNWRPGAPPQAKAA